MEKRIFDLSIAYEKEKISKLFIEERFDDPTYQDEVLSEMPKNDRPKKVKEINLQPELLNIFGSFYKESLLTAEQEYHLFRKLNFLKYRFSKLFDCMDENNLETVEGILFDIRLLKKQLFSCNMRFAIGMAKNRCESDLSEIISDAVVGLTKAIDYFDYRRKYKFSTYAYYVIRNTMDECRLKFAEYNNCDELLNVFEEKRHYEHSTDVVNKLIEKISDKRQKEIIVDYFGLNGKPAMKLKDIGKRLCITKEYARKLRNKGLEAIREKVSV